jgi:hypothetical protein
MALPRPELAPALDGADVEATVDHIVACQNPDGSLPWADGHVDTWNHVEAAMALTVGGRIHEARRAYRWLLRRQRPDGSWYASYRDGRAVDLGVDLNFCAYSAAGLWHHTLATGDDSLLCEAWPAIERAIGITLSLQQPAGEILWAYRTDGTPHDFALLTSSSAIHLSLRCALAAAAYLRIDRPDWEDAADRLSAAVALRPELFADKSGFSMDWYYPVLGGCVTGAAARVRLAAGWDAFVVDEVGARCIDERPWFTGAETCELVLALDALGRTEEAWRLFEAVQCMRDDSGGGYWTGVVLPEACPWPVEQPAWTAAAVVLAADALMALTPASGFFRALHADTDEELLEAEGA